MTYTANGQNIQIWARTRNGSTITMVLPGARFTFTKQWKKFEVTQTQLTWIQRQTRLIEVSTTDPSAVNPSQGNIVFQGIELSQTELTMVKGDNTTVGIIYLPEGVDISKLKPSVVSANPKIATVNLVNPKVVDITAKQKGTVIIDVSVGAIVKNIKVTVIDAPFFQSKEYTGKVGQGITLDIMNVEKADLTLPENVSVVEGNTIKADKPGTYEILASAMGRTFTTKLVVPNSTETTTD